MAVVTHPKRPLRVREPGNNFLSYAMRRHLEGASQAFTADSPLVVTGGYLVEAANPATSIFGFAKRPGRNAAAGVNFAEFLPAIDGLEVIGNFLASAAADNVLAITDVGGSYRIAKAAILADGSSAWYIEDTGTSTAAKMVGLQSDYTPSASAGAARKEPGFTEAGDTNARVTCVVLDSVRAYK